MQPVYERDGITVYHGDNREVVRHLDPDSISAVVTDPPYGLGFMGKAWDHGVPGVPFWEAFGQVMRPGAHLLAFGGSRTYHRIAVAIEDAGLEIRDTLQWLYGQGFPKSLDVSKAIDRMAGAEREVLSEWRTGFAGTLGGKAAYGGIAGEDVRTVTAPATDAARDWQGWGTALKPAYEPIILARKPLAGTVASTVLQHGTGALNIDACRINPGETVPGGGPSYGKCEGVHEGWKRPGHAVYENKPEHNKGRWPANVLLDETAADLLDAQSGELAAGNHPRVRNTTGYSGGLQQGLTGHSGVKMDTGGASRFFYCPKASRSERNAGLHSEPARAVHRYGAGVGEGHDPDAPVIEHNHHPTVKPIALMEWLLTLVTPPGGVVCDPFAGSGTTGVVAARLGIPCVLIEQEAEYLPIIIGRIDHALNDRATRPEILQASLLDVAD